MINSQPMVAVPVPHHVSPYKHYLVLGAHHNITTLAASSRRLSAVWLLDDTPPPLGHSASERQQLVHLAALLNSSNPCRLVVLIISTHDMYVPVSTLSTQHCSYTIPRGVTKQGDRWDMLCIQNQCVAALWPVAHATAVARVGPYLKRWGLTLWPTPAHTACHTLPQDVASRLEVQNLPLCGRPVLWTVWKRECSVREQALCTRNWRSTVLASCLRVNQVLHLAPCAHLHWRYDILHIPTHNHLTAFGTWWYGAYSVADGKIYFRQTGAIHGETSVGNRFLRKVADARAWHKLYG